MASVQTILAITGISFGVLVVLGGIIVGVLIYLKVIKINPKASSPAAEVAPVQENVVTEPDTVVLSEPETESVVLSEPETLPPAAPTPAAPEPAAPEPTAPEPAAPTPAAPTPAAPAPATPTPAVPAALTASSFIDRGCWRDGGYRDTPSAIFGNMDRWNIFDPINRAINTVSINLRADPATASLLNNFDAAKDYAIQLCLAGNYDTFAFQNGEELFLGKYGSFINGTIYKYDKFGSSNAVCVPFGGPWINHVFSAIAPLTHTYQESDFVDRGCWYDGILPNSTAAYTRMVAKSWINMTNTGVPRSDWLNYAKRRAATEGYDTFAFQADFALFFGNYNSEYRYDKLGAVPIVNGCQEFGTGNINRVYSVVAPALPTPTARLPGNTATANVITKASDWLSSKNWFLKRQ